jgi:AraC family transcriptional regulator, arabinose operon regulatory protein
MATERAPSLDPRVRIIIRRIDESVRRGDVVTFDSLATMVNLSRSRLRHLFKAGAGFSLAECLKTARLAYARELIETTFLSVKQVRGTVGFTDSSHFTREFKRLWGRSPSQHRRSFLAAADTQIQPLIDTARTSHELTSSRR